MVHLYVEILPSHLKFCGWIFIDIESCSQSCQLKRVIWAIKYHVYHSPVLVRIWMCDHRSLEINVLGDLSGSIWCCSFKLLFTCFFFMFFFSFFFLLQWECIVLQCLIVVSVCTSLTFSHLLLGLKLKYNEVAVSPWWPGHQSLCPICCFRLGDTWKCYFLNIFWFCTNYIM